MRGLFLLFVVMPIVEIMLLFKVGTMIGALPTIALVVTTAFIGINILRQQGFATMRRAQGRMAAGELPGLELIEGFMLAIGGALLLTPGLVTDVIGFLLLIPPSRQALAKYILKSGKLQAYSAGAGSASFTVFGGGFNAQGRAGPSAHSTIVEGEVVRDESEEESNKSRLLDSEKE